MSRPTQSRPLPPVPPLTVAEGIELVEARLAGLLSSREPLLTEVATYLVGSGGKRVRPAVMLLVYRACGGRERDDIVDMATALELIHSATLLHDDIIDDSATRRGKQTAHRRYGLATTLVTGDFVFSRAFQVCGRFDEQIVAWAADACVSLTEGEIMQSRFRHNAAVRVDDYLEIISRKTASIFQQGARSAAYLARARPQVIEAVGRCGFNVGMTFQVVDDLLDVAGTEAHLGKPVGNDVRDGNPSLPMVLALHRDPALAAFFENRDPDEGAMREALSRVRATGVLDEVRSLAARYAARALDCLDVLPPSSDRDELVALVQRLVDRAT